MKARLLLSAAGLSAAVGTAGCTLDPASTSETVATDGQSISWFDAWTRQWSPVPVDPGATAGTTSRLADAAICRGKQGAIFVGRDLTSNRYRTAVWWRLFSANPVWKDVGNTAYTSKPACTDLDELVAAWDPAPPINNHIFIVGKNADNRYYARTMKVDTTIEPDEDPLFAVPEQPTLIVNGHLISNSTYASAPATTVAFGKVIVVGRRSSGNPPVSTLWLHQNTLTPSTPATPYSSGAWDSQVRQLPALPGGWQAAGDPTIANSAPIIGVVTIMTRATKAGNADRLYYAFWNGASFSAQGWVPYPIGNTVISSDPALEVDAGGSHDWVATVWVRGATRVNGVTTDPNRIYQSSTDFVTFETFTIARPIGAMIFTGAPAAIGRGEFEGYHMAIAKRDDGLDQIYFVAPDVH